MKKLIWPIISVLNFSLACAADGNISLSVVKVDEGISNAGMTLLAAIAVAVFAVIYVIIQRRKKPKKTVVEELVEGAADEDKDDPEPDLEIKPTTTEAEKYLKEEELVVVNVLKNKGGKTSQGTLRVVTNFSKAKLSRILKELDERGIIHKEQHGKKNIVTLKNYK